MCHHEESLSQENILNIFPGAKGTNKLFAMITLHLWRMDEKGIDQKEADQLGGSFRRLDKHGEDEYKWTEVPNPGYCCLLVCSFSLLFLSSVQQALSTNCVAGTVPGSVGSTDLSRDLLAALPFPEAVWRDRNTQFRDSQNQFCHLESAHLRASHLAFLSFTFLICK